MASIQAAFIRGLTEDNGERRTVRIGFMKWQWIAELAQDVSSMALGALYTLGDESQRNAMVQELVETLSTGKRPSRPLQADTKLFHGATLGTTPTGCVPSRQSTHAICCSESLGTYRELCSLATDLNQPDLIYKFLQLANHNAMWNSKLVSICVYLA